MSQTHKHTSWLRAAWEFIKLQLAGNILFFGTMAGFYIGEHWFGTPHLLNLAVASLVANVLFFVVDRDWVFTSEGKKRQGPALQRFIIFMTFNFFLNLALIELFAWLLRSGSGTPITSTLYTIWITATGWLEPVFGSLHHNWEFYVAQFLSGLVFAVWSYVGFKFWVFAPVKHHARTSRHYGLTPTRRTYRIRRRRQRT